MRTLVGMYREVFVDLQRTCYSQPMLCADRLHRAGMQFVEIRAHRRFHYIRRYVSFWVIRSILRM